MHDHILNEALMFTNKQECSHEKVYETHTEVRIQQKNCYIMMNGLRLPAVYPIIPYAQHTVHYEVRYTHSRKHTHTQTN